MDIKMDLSILDDIAKKFNTQIMSDIEDKIATDLEMTVEMKSPRDSGNLANNWQVKRTGNGFTLENRTHYASYVIDGTRPHEIRARNASALSFVMNGKQIFAKSVKHPGTKPNPFVDNSIDEVMSRVDRIVEKALKDGGLL